MSYNTMLDYAKFDVQLMERGLSQPARLVPRILFDDYNGSWIQSKRRIAELEAHRERVRQVFARSFGAAKGSAEWAQGLVYIQNATSVEKLKIVCDSFDIVWKEEGDMATKNEEINALKSQIAELNRKLTKVEHGRMGIEPANGTVYKIEKRYEAGGKGYVFAAVRAGGFWFLTGTGNDGTKSYTWEALKAFVGKYSRVWLMTAKEEVVD